MCTTFNDIWIVYFRLLRVNRSAQRPSLRSVCTPACRRCGGRRVAKEAIIRQGKERLEEREAHLRVSRDQQAVRASGSDRDPEDGEACG